FLVRSAPGGPFDTDKRLPEEIMRNLNEHYHLNDPLFKQYTDYLGSIARFDFGPSFKFTGRNVNDMIREGFPVTLELGIYSILVALGLGVISGVMGALKPNTLRDYIPMSLAMIGICMPTFLMGPLLVLIFGIWMHLLPVSG